MPNEGLQAGVLSLARSPQVRLTSSSNTVVVRRVVMSGERDLQDVDPRVRVVHTDDTYGFDVVRDLQVADAMGTNSSTNAKEGLPYRVQHFSWLCTSLQLQGGAVCEWMDASSFASLATHN